MWRWITRIIYLYIDIYYIFFGTVLQKCSAAYCTFNTALHVWVSTRKTLDNAVKDTARLPIGPDLSAVKYLSSDSGNAGEGAALVFSSKGECDSHPLAGSAPGRPLWATMTRRVEEDLHHSLMNLWWRKWKQPLARSSGACGAAAAVEMGEKLGLKQKPLKTL